MARYLRTIDHHSDFHTYLLCPPLAVINLTVQRKSLTRFCCMDVRICAYSATRAVVKSVDDVRSGGFGLAYLSYGSLVGLRLGLCAISFTGIWSKWSWNKLMPISTSDEETVMIHNTKTLYCVLPSFRDVWR